MYGYARFQLFSNVLVSNWKTAFVVFAVTCRNSRYSNGFAGRAELKTGDFMSFNSWKSIFSYHIGINVENKLKFKHEMFSSKLAIVKSTIQRCLSNAYLASLTNDQKKRNRKKLITQASKYWLVVTIFNDLWSNQ